MNEETSEGSSKENLNGGLEELEYFKNLVENAPVGIYRTRLNGDIVYANEALAKIFDFKTPEDMMKENVILRYSNIERRKELLNQLKEKGSVNNFEIEVATKNNDIKYILISANLKDEEISGIIVNITSGKQAEQQVVESERKYKQLIESVKDTIVEIDDHGNFTYISPQVVNKSGFTPEEMMKINAFELVHPDDLEKVLENMEKALKDKTIVSLEYRTKHKKGHYYPVYALGSLLIEGESMRYIGSVRDISAQKNAEAKIIEERNRAEFYLDLLSHDINNLNQAIISSNELILVQSGGDDRTRKYAQTSLDQANAISTLITNVRKLSELKDKGIEDVSINASKVVNSSIDRIARSYPDRNIEINNSIKDTGIVVKCNSLISDIFDNILGNAVKYSRNQDVRINISAAPDENDEFWIFNFEDNGPGVPDKMKERIFRRFERGDESVHGSGLGLTIAHEIASSCGGKVWVEDKIDGESSQGSKFVIKLPKE